VTGQRVASEGSRSGFPTPELGHPSEVAAAHERVLAGSPARSRYVEVTPGQRVHLIEAGEGAPLVLIHGSGPSALLFLPLLARLEGLRAIAVDRPGFGLSDPAAPTEMPYREAGAGWVTSVIDALGLEETALLGSSTGGTWALWYTLAHTDRVRRLVLLGALPLVEGTSVPPPMLGIASADTGEPPPQMPPPSPETVIQSMSVMGEADTIVNYPDQIDALVVAGQDPVASNASLAELRTIIAPTGWQQELETPLEELGQLAVPTLLIWGENDPLGGADVAQAAASSIPGARLELLAAGHAPWLGHPDRTATLVSDFAR
jgi:pimeloyl-ACP methyl ester carboxylesterase